MIKNKKHIPAKNMAVGLLVLLNAVILANGFTMSEKWYWLLIVFLPLLLLAVRDNSAKSSEKSQADTATQTPHSSSAQVA